MNIPNLLLFSALGEMYVSEISTKIRAPPLSWCYTSRLELLEQYRAASSDKKGRGGVLVGHPGFPVLDRAMIGLSFWAHILGRIMVELAK